MINYDATLKAFFAEIIKYLDNRATHAKDRVAFFRIERAREIVEKIAENPSKYANYNVRVKKDMIVDARAFMPTSNDNSVFLLYRGVLNIISDLNSEIDWVRSNSQASLLKALKQIKYKNATNIFKDFYYPFLPASKFAVQEKTK